MKKHITYLILALLPTGFLMSQSIEDVTRFSQTTYLGSARFIGAGGAFTSLGNDFTAVHQNPAGLAVYRRTEFSLSMGALNAGTISSFNGKSTSEDVGRFNFGNIGLVFAMPEQNGWNWNVGFSLNKSADYTNRFSPQSESNGTSRIERWLENSQGINPDNLLQSAGNHEHLAYQSFLTDNDLDFNYTTQANTEVVNSLYTLNQKGGMNEFAILFAAEQDNRWYFGGSIGIPFLNYSRDVVYSESFGNGGGINSFDLKQHDEISGVGFNMKFGMQYRFDNGVRAGAAIHTPSWFTLEQSWEDEIFTRFSDGSDLDEVPTVFSDPYTWKLSTPWRGLLGISKVFGKNGFLSVDYELNAMNTARSKSDSINIDYLDEEIKQFTQLSHVVRAGAELRLNRFYLRGGYVFQTSGVTGDYEQTNRDIISFGAGYRANDLSIDFAYALSNRSQEIFFYDGRFSSSAQSNITQKPLTFTMSYRIGNR